jgi:hypothetical protein
MLDVGGWREGYPEDVMSSRTTAAAFDPTEWSQKGFTERVRIGTNAYVLQGIGYPLPVYLFHAVKLTVFVLGWMYFCASRPASAPSRTSRRGSSRVRRSCYGAGENAANVRVRVR